jgi:hypothetical protein
MTQALYAHMNKTIKILKNKQTNKNKEVLMEWLKV